MGELAEVEALMAPFKVENVRLSRALKHARAQITCVLQALREFFADPTRREWFKQRKEDKPLCDFFQRLINWYRTVTEESDSTISFYTRIWEYERGDVVDSLQKKPSAESTVDNGSSDGHTLESAASSTNLYEACRQRTENTRLSKRLLDWSSSTMPCSEPTRRWRKSWRPCALRNTRMTILASAGGQCRGRSRGGGR